MPASEKFRLTDINVEEVSVVDRAANQRRFLIVKNAGGTKPGAEVIVGKDGSLTIEKAPGAPAVSPPETGAPPAAPAAPAAPAPENEPPAPMIPAAMRIAIDVKEEIARRIDLVLASFEEIRAMLGSAEVVEGEVEVPQEILTALNAALDVLETGGPDETVAKKIEKGLKQFSRTRMASLRTALDSLSSIVNEIEGVKSEPEPEIAPAPEVDSFAELAKQSDIRSMEVEIVKGMSAIVSVIKKTQEKISSDFAEQRATIEKSIAPNEISTREVASSNASEETPATPSSGGSAWPVDMNQKAPHAKA